MIGNPRAFAAQVQRIEEKLDALIKLVETKLEERSTTTATKRKAND